MGKKIRYFIIGLALSLQANAQSERLEELLQDHLANNPKLPSLAALVIVDGKVKAVGASGVRKKGDKTPVTIDDKYHIGSCSKAFTATLAATLVEDGTLTWDTTIADSLTSIGQRSAYGQATLKQMLSNTGGFSKDVTPAIWTEAWELKGSPQNQRKAFAKSVLKETPNVEPGTQYIYSNTGFSVAGVMMEATTRKSWESLIQTRIFDPLEMKSAGFYAPASKRNKPDQPWGHRSDGTPVPPGPGADNPPAIAPANAIHSSLPDLAKWMQLHLQQEIGPVLKERASYETLHTPILSNYALGWIVSERGWTGGKALNHVGSNTMYTCVIWIAPEKDFAVIVASNIGSDIAFEPCDQVVGQMVQQYLD
ncbi:MAG: serine hydrolase domain-containing protein [Opitutaceae bacterium]